jgi:Peptidase family M48
LQGGTTIVLGDPGLPSATWTDSKTASAALAQYCRQMELDADLAGLMLMASAGYHPDFAAALHHLLHSQDMGATTNSLYAMHPCWEERDHELQRAYTQASIEFGHLWPEWYASPGGNPPVVVFEESPKLRRGNSDEWEIQIPLRCQNLAGAVEVVLRSRSSLEGGPRSTSKTSANSQVSNSPQELRQLTGCTSPTTTVTFSLSGQPGQKKPAGSWTDVCVLDAWGTVLSRADIPNIRH